MRLDGDAWAARFQGFTREAFRLELLPQYLVPQEADTLEAWRAGATRPPDIVGPWQHGIRAAAGRGAVMRRVHVVRSPLSEYLRFEIAWYYGPNAAAGEQIRILDLARTPDPGLPVHDFWMFDASEVVLMLYESDGTQIGRELLEGVDPGPFVEYRDRAWAAAVPLADYRP